MIGFTIDIFAPTATDIIIGITLNDEMLIWKYFAFKIIGFVMQDGEDILTKFGMVYWEEMFDFNWKIVKIIG
jgi:hypothetical protein